MSQPYTADDYSAIAQRLREIEGTKAHNAQKQPNQKWGIWYRGAPASWVHVARKGGWSRATEARGATLYASQAAAQAAIDVESPEIRQYSTAKEFPGAE